MKDPAKLMEIAREVVADKSLEPVFKDGKFIRSFCNRGADQVFTKYGGPGFPRTDKGDVILADSIYCWMTDNQKDFRKIDVGTVQTLASSGSLIFACMTSKMLAQDAGHICIAIPGEATISAHWGCDAPSCMNIGFSNFIGMPMSYAFRRIPDFFVWVPSL